MSHQAPHQITPRAPLPPATIEELLADPSRTRGLVLESVPELLSQVALRVAALKKSAHLADQSGSMIDQPLPRGGAPGCPAVRASSSFSS